MELLFARTPAHHVPADNHRVALRGGRLLRLLVCFGDQGHADSASNGRTCSHANCHGGGRGNRYARGTIDCRAGTCVHSRADAGTHTHSSSSSHGNPHSDPDGNLHAYPHTYYGALPTTRRERLLRPGA